jgi:hypothetical protein
MGQLSVHQGDQRLLVLLVKISATCYSISLRAAEHTNMFLNSP